jgi:hypothetical protein
MATNQGAAAFPDETEYGLTKREYFSAKALQGILAGPNNMTTFDSADTAVKCADQLIKALNEIEPDETNP